jgi:hypothetical protein
MTGASAGEKEAAKLLRWTLKFLAGQVGDEEFARNAQAFDFDDLE